MPFPLPMKMQPTRKKCEISHGIRILLWFSYRKVVGAESAFVCGFAFVWMGFPLVGWVCLFVVLLWFCLII